MEEILIRIEAADGLVLASPVNFFGVTAVTQRFIERLVCYACWPWGKPGPALRVKDRGIRAVLVTSSAMPAALGRMFTRSLGGLKRAAQTLERNRRAPFSSARPPCARNRICRRRSWKRRGNWDTNWRVNDLNGSH